MLHSAQLLHINGGRRDVGGAARGGCSTFGISRVGDSVGQQRPRCDVWRRVIELPLSAWLNFYELKQLGEFNCVCHCSTSLRNNPLCVVTVCVCVSHVRRKKVCF